MRIPYGARKVKQKNGGLLPGGSRPPFLMQAADENVGVGYQKVTGAHKSAYLCGKKIMHTMISRQKGGGWNETDRFPG